jgi:hypothetical protein
VVLESVSHLTGVQQVFNVEVEITHSYFVGHSRTLVHNQEGISCTAGTGLPSTPGVYHIELNGEVYTGSAANVAERLENPTHPAAALLDDPARRVKVWGVDLGMASTESEVNHVLRYFEQTIMDLHGNLPQKVARRLPEEMRASFSTSVNEIRAGTPEKLKNWASEVDDLGASVNGSATSH